MWHQDCCKADFFVVTQIDMLHDDCWVDRQDHYDFDLSETPVGHRVLDPVHANKNSLRGILRQLYKYRDAMDDDILVFVRTYKPGDPIVAPRPPGGHGTRHQFCRRPRHAKRSHCKSCPFFQIGTAKATINGRLAKAKTLWKTSMT